MLTGDMAGRFADWAPGVRRVPAVRELVEKLFEAVEGGAMDSVFDAFERLIQLADGRGDREVKDAARRALLKLAARYRLDEVLAAQKAKARRAGGESVPPDPDDEYTMIMALLTGVCLNLPPPKSRT